MDLLVLRKEVEFLCMFWVDYWRVNTCIFEELNMEVCTYCPQNATTDDHIIPLSRGGSNDKKNKVPCCKLCNSTRGNMDQSEFIQFMDFTRERGVVFHELSRSKRRELKAQFLKKTGIRVGFQGDYQLVV